MITPRQIREARALLGWSGGTLALKSGLSFSTISAAETDAQSRYADRALPTIKRTLERAGVIFVAENGDGPGVRLRKGVPTRAEEGHD